jgi:hypothetical protein
VIPSIACWEVSEQPGQRQFGLSGLEAAIHRCPDSGLGRWLAHILEEDRGVAAEVVDVGLRIEDQMVLAGERLDKRDAQRVGITDAGTGGKCNLLPPLFHGTGPRTSRPAEWA